MASARWRKVAVVPVEANVAATLRATCPDLPNPLTISFPRQLRIHSTASTKDSPRLSAYVARVSLIHVFPGEVE